MGWRTTGDVADFLAAAGPFLRGDRVRNTVLLTVTETIRENPALHRSGPAGPAGRAGWCCPSASRNPTARRRTRHHVTRGGQVATVTVTPFSRDAVPIVAVACTTALTFGESAAGVTRYVAVIA